MSLGRGRFTEPVSAPGRDSPLPPPCPATCAPRTRLCSSGTWRTTPGRCWAETPGACATSGSVVAGSWPRGKGGEDGGLGARLSTRTRPRHAALPRASERARAAPRGWRRGPARPGIRCPHAQVHVLGPGRFPAPPSPREKSECANGVEGDHGGGGASLLLVPLWPIRYVVGSARRGAGWEPN